MDKYIVKEAARGRWHDIFSALTPALEDAMAHPSRHVACPVHGGKDGFRLFRDFNDTGGAICNTCGPFSDGFSVLMWLNGWNFDEVINHVGDHLRCGMKTPPYVARPVASAAAEPDVNREAEEKRRRSARLRQIWEECVQFSDPKAEPAWWYLVTRGLSARTCAMFSSLRVHPALPYYDGNELKGEFPALVAQVMGTDDKPVTLHRTYLTQMGGKLAVESPKKLMPLFPGRTLQGAAIRMGVPDTRLCIAEGIETALSVREATGITTWATVNAWGMMHFVPPAGVEEVWIWADKDRSDTGLQAAKQAKAKLWQHGIIARLFMPDMPIPPGSKGADWNDVLQYVGLMGFHGARAMKPLRRMPVANELPAKTGQRQMS